MNILNKLVITVVSTSGVALALLQVESVQAATIGFNTATVVASDNLTGDYVLLSVPTPVGTFNAYAFNNLDNGSGTASNISGFSSLADISSPADVTFTFGDLELVNFIDGGQTATQEFANNDTAPAFFNLLKNGSVIATSTDVELTVVTNRLSGTAAGFGQITFNSSDQFSREVQQLTNGSGTLNIALADFIPLDPIVGVPRSVDRTATFQSSGTFNTQPVPEPLTIAGTVVAGGIGWLMKRKQATAPKVKS